MIVERVGEDAVRIRVDGPLPEASSRIDATLRALRTDLGDRIEETWRGARALLATFRTPPTEDDLERCRRVAADPPSSYAVVGGLHHMRVRYDGEDLPEIAAACGRSVDEIVALHSGATYHVSFLGFAPGFAYLFGTPEPLASLPRRATPRPRVPPGAVAIAGGWTGIYPSAMPGGWHLLGTLLDGPIFDAHRSQPAAFVHIRSVRFEPA